MTTSTTTSVEAGSTGLAALPASIWRAMHRGALGHCARCGGPGLFDRFLKPTPTCPACGQDWTLHQADDFPPYVSIFITGHLMAPVIISLAFVTLLPMWGKMLLVASVAACGVQPARAGLGLMRHVGAWQRWQWWRAGAVAVTRRTKNQPRREPV